MSDFIPKAGAVKIGGLGRAAQKLQAARDKAAQVKSGAKPLATASVASFKAKDSSAQCSATVGVLGDRDTEVIEFVFVC